MYKRIAAHTTANVISTARYNWKNKHYMRIGMYIGGTYISGMTRVALLKSLFGQTLPDEKF